MAKYLISCLLISTMLLSSCAPAMFTSRELSKLNFEQTPYYETDLNKIPKPDKLKPIFVDKNFKETTKENAEYVLLVPKEYAKIAGLLKLCKAYKDIIKEQEVLINANIDIVNSLKEFVELERLKAQEYQNLWVDAENSYRHEQYYHKLDNAVNKGSFILLTLGIIAVLIAL